MPSSSNVHYLGTQTKVLQPHGKFESSSKQGELCRQKKGLSENPLPLVVTYILLLLVLHWCKCCPKSKFTHLICWLLPMFTISRMVCKLFLLSWFLSICWVFHRGATQACDPWCKSVAQGFYVSVPPFCFVHHVVGTLVVLISFLTSGSGLVSRMRVMLQIWAIVVQFLSILHALVDSSIIFER